MANSYYSSMHSYATALQSPASAYPSHMHREPDHLKGLLETFAPEGALIRDEIHVHQIVGAAQALAQRHAYLRHGTVVDHFITHDYMLDDMHAIARQRSKQFEPAKLTHPLVLHGNLDPRIAEAAFSRRIK